MICGIDSFHKIILIFKLNVGDTKAYFVQYLSVPHNIVMDMNNVMFGSICLILLWLRMNAFIFGKGLMWMDAKYNDHSNPQGVHSSYILHTRAFGTYLLGRLFTLQKGLQGDGILHVKSLKILYVMIFYM